MNFLQLLASGASLLNFNFQSKSTQNVETLPKAIEKQDGFKKVENNHVQIQSLDSLNQPIPNEQATILNQMLYNERQELINRYLQLNLQLLSDKLTKQATLIKPSDGQELNEELQLDDQNSQQQKNQSLKKKIKKAVKCGHDDKAHYAKGLCNNCYHKYGRTKKPWNCPHEKLYAGGMCQNCYINMYNKKKREEHSGKTPNDEKMENEHHDKNDVIVLVEQKKETDAENREHNN